MTMTIVRDIIKQMHLAEDLIDRKEREIAERAVHVMVGQLADQAMQELTLIRKALQDLASVHPS